MRKGPGSQEACLEERLSNWGSKNNRNYNSLVNRAWVLGVGGSMNKIKDLSLHCVCVCVCVFRGQRPGVDTVHNLHDPWCLKHKVWGLGGWGRHRPSWWSLSLQLQEVLDFPMIRSHTCFRYHGVRRRTFILFSTSLYIFKVRSSYFRGKSPTLYVCKLDILALLLFLSYIWQNGGGWELKSSILDAGLWLSWMGFTYLFWFFFLNWSIVNLQCWVSFKCTAKWFSYMCVCVYFSDLDVFSLILNKAILF